MFFHPALLFLSFVQKSCLFRTFLQAIASDPVEQKNTRNSQKARCCRCHRIYADPKRDFCHRTDQIHRNDQSKPHCHPEKEVPDQLSHRKFHKNPPCTFLCRGDTVLFFKMMMPGSKGQKAVHACMIRLLNLGPAKHEKVAIYAVNQRISNVCRIVRAACSGAIRRHQLGAKSLLPPGILKLEYCHSISRQIIGEGIRSSVTL